MKSQSAVAVLVSLFILATGMSRATVPDTPRKIRVLSEGFLEEPRTSHQTQYSINFKLLDNFDEAVIDCRLIDVQSRLGREVPKVRTVPTKDVPLNTVLNVPFSVAGKYELFVVIRTVDARRDSDVIHVSHTYIELGENGAKVFAKPPEDFGKRIISNNSTLKPWIPGQPDNPVISVSGRITYYNAELSSEQALPFVRIYISDGGPDARWATTDGNGNYSVLDWHTGPTFISVQINNGVAFGDGGSFFPQTLGYWNATGNITNADISVTPEIAKVLDNLRIAGNFSQNNWGWMRPPIPFAFDWGNGVAFYSSSNDRITFYALYQGTTEIWGSRGRDRCICPRIRSRSHV